MVEQGKAPNSLLATAPADTPWPGRIRPLCAYPDQTRYLGHGSIEDAVNFVCAAARDDDDRDDHRHGHDDD